MNTNEISSKAPEKIFLLKNRLGVILNSFCVEPDKVLDNIEYVQLDAFIDKACAFLETYPHMFMGVLRSEIIEDFKKYMKGE